MAIHERYFTIGDAYSGEITSAAQRTNIFGSEVTVGEGSKPEPEAYPGWEQFPLEYPAGSPEEGWVFSLAPGSATPIGFIDNPKDMSETDPVPTTREFAVEGTGIVIVSSPLRHVYAWVVSSRYPAVLELHPGCVISYIALRDGFTGVSINSRKGIPESAIDIDDKRVPPEFKEIYTFWKDYAQHQISS